MYPENWRVTEDTAPGGKATSFMLESPTSAFMTVSEFPWNVAPNEAVEKAKEAMEAEYQDIEFEPFSPELTIGGEAIKDLHGGEIHFYYLDLLVVSRLIAFTMESTTYLIQVQAEDRDFETLDRVFQAMILSMLKSLEP
jgi:hypothetical protein